MKEIVVISGKGGTGKTSLAASFVNLAERPVIADCDVDAADLHLVLTPRIKSEEEFSGGKLARILPEKCTACGKCADVCRFGAVEERNREDGGKKYVIDPIACEGCGVCAWFCPEKTIEFKEAVNGKWFISNTRYGPMVHARLGVAQENSGKLVTLVRNQAKRIAEENEHPYVIVDGAPGIGCPVIASIVGADLVVIVTEPTVAGRHDLGRVAQLTGHFDIPTVVCINKCDLNREVADKIRREAGERNIDCVGDVRYDKAVTKAQTARATVTEYTSGPVSQEIEKAWRHIVYALG